MNVLQLTAYKDHIIKVVVDDSPENPREWDNLGRMICFHNRYNLGDKHNLSRAEAERIYCDDKKYISLPLYLYDHSGLTMNTTGFSCPWDSGQVGIIYVEKKTILDEYGGKKISAKRKEKFKDILRGEVATYDQFLTGSVLGYVTEKEGETVDSCWGFYCTREEVLQEAKDNIVSP